MTQIYGMKINKRKEKESNLPTMNHVKTFSVLPSYFRELKFIGTLRGNVTGRRALLRLNG
jgi:hypothetical protein